MDTAPSLPKAKRARERAIYKLLRKAGHTQRSFALLVGKAPSMVSVVIRGKAKSTPVALELCKTLGFEHPADLWPNLYSRESLPKAS